MWPQQTPIHLAQLFLNVACGDWKKWLVMSLQLLLIMHKARGWQAVDPRYRGAKQCWLKLFGFKLGQAALTCRVRHIWHSNLCTAMTTLALMVWWLPHAQPTRFGSKDPRHIKLSFLQVFLSITSTWQGSHVDINHDVFSVVLGVVVLD